VLATVLALLASVLWGTSDFGAGLMARRMTVWAVVIVGMVTAAGTLALLAVGLHRHAPPSATVAILVIGGALSAASAFTYFRSLTFTKMSVASPILAGSAVLPVLWGLVHGDQPHPAQLLGMVAAIAGIVVISRPGPTAEDDAMPVTLKGVVLAVIGSTCAGLMVVTLDYGAAADPIWAVAGLRCSAAVWAIAWIGVMRPKLRMQRRLVPLLALIGLMMAAANLLFATATTLQELSIVAVLGWLGPAVTILCARLFLHEHLRPVQWLAALTVLAGVVLLALG
jgi:drug/metabolite transporter (DMT)-like permease